MVVGKSKVCCIVEELATAVLFDRIIAGSAGIRFNELSKSVGTECRKKTSEDYSWHILEKWIKESQGKVIKGAEMGDGERRQHVDYKLVAEHDGDVEWEYGDEIPSYVVRMMKSDEPLGRAEQKRRAEQEKKRARPEEVVALTEKLELGRLVASFFMMYGPDNRKWQRFKRKYGDMQAWVERITVLKGKYVPGERAR